MALAVTALCQSCFPLPYCELEQSCCDCPCVVVKGLPVFPAIFSVLVGTGTKNPHCLASDLQLKIIESQNHRKFWVGRDPQRSSSPTPLQRAGTPLTRSGCSEPCPTWSGMCPGMGPPLPLWATHSSVSQPSL